MSEMENQIIGDFIDAAVNDQPKADQLLRQYPELRDARWFGGETALHFLAVEEYTEAVQFLCRLGFDVNVKNEDGETPLLDAATLGYEEIAKILIEYGADPNYDCYPIGNVLTCAVRSGNPRLVELLLKAGAKADFVDDIGWNIFNWLPDDPEQRESILKVLDQHGIRVNPIK